MRGKIIPFKQPYAQEHQYIGAYIRNGIYPGAKFGLLFQQPGNQSIEHISDQVDDDQHGKGLFIAGQRQNKDYRKRQQPVKREYIGDVKFVF